MRRVIVESPFAGRGSNPVSRWWSRLQNKRYARAAVRDCILRGESPIASHLLLTQPGVLRDDDPNERNMGIDAGHAWLPVSDAAVFYIDRGFSRGMDQGLLRATEARIPVERRTLRWGNLRPTVSR